MSEHTDRRDKWQAALKDADAAVAGLVVIRDEAHAEYKRLSKECAQARQAAYEKSLREGKRV